MLFLQNVFSMVGNTGPYLPVVKSAKPVKMPENLYCPIAKSRWLTNINIEYPT